MKASRSVSEKRQQPGNYCRTWLRKDIRRKLFSILPQCQPKQELEKSIQMFTEIMTILSKRLPTDQDIMNYSEHVNEWIVHKKREFNEECFGHEFGRLRGTK